MEKGNTIINNAMKSGRQQFELTYSQSFYRIFQEDKNNLFRLFYVKYAFYNLYKHIKKEKQRVKLLNWDEKNIISTKKAFPFSRGSSQPRSPVLQADSLLSEPLGKLKTKELIPNLCICFSLFFLFRIHFVNTAKLWCRSPHPRIRRTDALTRNDNAELGR